MRLLVALEAEEGAGNAGCRPHPWPACNKKSRRQSPQVRRNSRRHSLRNGLTAYLALSLVYRAFLATIACTFVTHKLDPSVGRSGPHDFAVRVSRARLARQHAHRIPLPTSVRIAIRLLWTRDARIRATDLPDVASESACDRLTRRAKCAWRICVGAAHQPMRNVLSAMFTGEEPRLLTLI